MAIYGIKLHAYGQCHYYSSEDSTIQVEDRVVVPEDERISVGLVVHGPMPALPHCEEQTLPQILRRATLTDLAEEAENARLAQDAKTFCRNCIEQRQLDMKLVKVEVFFDRSKIIFFFTAPTRIDFRELVKDLVRRYHTRIELRQIGVRHETQMIGAIGSCGKVCCCRQYLRKFAPVTIRMAKEQNLFLNPAKISGSCGRLLCCLSYEQENYDAFFARSPRLEKVYHTTRGDLKVVRTNMFSNTVAVIKAEDAEKEGEVQETVFSIEEWKTLNPVRADGGRDDVRDEDMESEGDFLEDSFATDSLDPCTNRPTTDHRAPDAVHMESGPAGSHGGKERGSYRSRLDPQVPLQLHQRPLQRPPQAGWKPRGGTQGVQPGQPRPSRPPFDPSLERGTDARFSARPPRPEGEERSTFPRPLMDRLTPPEGDPRFYPMEELMPVSSERPSGSVDPRSYPDAPWAEVQPFVSPKIIEKAPQKGLGKREEPTKFQGVQQKQPNSRILHGPERAWGQHGQGTPPPVWEGARETQNPSLSQMGQAAYTKGREQPIKEGEARGMPGAGSPQPQSPKQNVPQKRAPFEPREGEMATRRPVGGERVPLRPRSSGQPPMYRDGRGQPLGIPERKGAQNLPALPMEQGHGRGHPSLAHYVERFGKTEGPKGGHPDNARAAGTFVQEHGDHRVGRETGKKKPKEEPRPEVKQPEKRKDKHINRNRVNEREIRSIVEAKLAREARKHNTMKPKEQHPKGRQQNFDSFEEELLHYTSTQKTEPRKGGKPSFPPSKKQKKNRKKKSDA